MHFGVDLDGTLLDSHERHMVVLRAAADSLKISLSEDCIEGYLAAKRQGSSGYKVLKDLGISQAGPLSKRWIMMIEEPRFLSLDVLFPRVIALLETRVAAGDRFTLVTARSNELSVYKQIEKLKILTLCEDVRIVKHGNNCSLGEAKAAACKQGGSIDIVMGDTEVDLEWANALSIPFVALHSGFRSKEYWARWHGIQSHADFSAALFAATAYNQEKMLP